MTGLWLRRNPASICDLRTVGQQNQSQKESRSLYVCVNRVAHCAGMVTSSQENETSAL